MADFFDALETRDPAVREADLMGALPAQIAHAKTHAPYFGKVLADVEAQAVVDREALAKLPVTHKSDLIALQQASPPFGGLAAGAAGEFAHLLTSPGPLYELEGEPSDYARCARAFFAAGFRRGDIVQNTFSYHLSPGAWIIHSGLRALGCAVIPAGVGNTEQQLQAIAHFKPQGYAGVPDFLKTLLDKADDSGVDISCISKALVSGAALPNSLRAELRQRGVVVYQAYATADLGLIAYESPAEEGLILDESLVLEIVRPGTGDPVPTGEVGEVVITTLNPHYPLIRFATGDLSAILPGASPCGRSNTRLKGWMGRADQTTKVKGLFIHPSQIAKILERHSEIQRARLVVTRVDEADQMTLQVEAAEKPGLTAAIEQSLQAVTKLRGAVTVIAPGSLPNDGKVIDDTRPVD